MDLFEARRLAVTLLHRHGLGSWRLVMGRARTQAGSCRHDRRTITLSTPLVAAMTQEELVETVRHEIAHALVGPGHHHDEVWRRAAEAIGASGEVTLRIEQPPEPDWTGTCPAGHTLGRHRRPTQPVACRTCSPAFDAGALLDWRYRGKVVPMSPAYRSQERALLAGAGLARGA